jgi:hypothetical protein
MAVSRGMPIRSFLICAAAIALAFLIVDNRAVLFGAVSRGQVIGRDLHPFWYGATLVWQGHAATLFDPHLFVPAYQAFMGEETGFTPFPYPPTALVFYAPLGLLPYIPALVLWLLATLLAFLFVVGRACPDPKQAMIALLLSPAVLTNFAGGQNGCLSGLLLCGGLLALKRHPILAGIAFGLLTYKPQLGLVIPFVLLAGGYYRTIAIAGLTCALVGGGTLLLLGADSWSLYFTQSAPLQRQLMETGTGPFTLMAPSTFMAGRLWGLPLAIDYALQIVVAIGAIIVAVWAFRRKDAPHSWKAAVAMIAALLATPYSFTYDMCVVAAAQVLLVQNAMRPLGAVHRLIHATVWLVPIVMIPFSIGGVPIAPISLLALLFVAATDAMPGLPQSASAPASPERASRSRTR